MGNPYLDDAPAAPAQRRANPYLAEPPTDSAGPALGDAPVVQRGPTTRRSASATIENLNSRAVAAMERGVPRVMVEQRFMDAARERGYVLLGDTAPTTVIKDQGLGVDPFAELGHQAPGHVIARQPVSAMPGYGPIDAGSGNGLPAAPYRKTPGIPEELFFNQIPTGATYIDTDGNLQTRKTTAAETGLALANRSAELAGQLGDFVVNLKHNLDEKSLQMELDRADALGEAPDARFVADMQTRLHDDPIANTIRGVASIARNPEVASRPTNVSVDDVLGDPLHQTLPFVAESSVRSLPDMVGAVTALPAYVAAITEGSAEQRRANNNEQGQPTLGDLAAALPGSIAQAGLERFGARRLFGPEVELANPGVSNLVKRLAGETAIQGTLGAAEESAGYLGETLGTERGVSAPDLGKTALAGFLSEAGLGTGLQSINEARARLGSVEALPDSVLEARLDPKSGATREQALEAALVLAQRRGAVPTTTSTRAATSEQERPSAPESAPPNPTARPSSPPATVDSAGQTTFEGRADAAVQQADELAARLRAASNEPAGASVPPAQPSAPAVSPDVATPAQARDPAAPVAGAAPTVDGVPAADTAPAPKPRVRVNADGSYGPPPAKEIPPYKTTGDFGPVFEQFKGDANGAISALRAAKDGDAIGALSHPDVGPIDLVWGSEPRGGKQGYGLAKIIAKHPEVMGDLQGFINTLQVVSRTDNRIQLESANGKAAVSLLWNGKAKQWLLTAFEKEKAGDSTTSDTAALPAEGDTARLGASQEPSVPPQADAGNPAPDAPNQPVDAQAPPLDAAPPAADAPREPAANGPRATSTKNVVTEAERAAENRDPILSDLAQSNESTLSEARATLEANPSRGAEVVERLRNEGTGAISVADEAVLLVEKVRLRNQRDAAAERASDPNASEETRAVARREFDDAEARINEMDQATVASGREWGRLGQFRQRMLREDFTFEALERRERVREGRPLTVEESAKLRDFAEKVQQLEEEVARTRAQLDEATANNASADAYRGLVQEMARALKGEQKGRPRLERLKSNAEESRAALRKMLGRTNAGVDPTAFYHLARIGAFHIAEGAVKFADWVSRMKADIGSKLFGEVEPALPDVFKAAQSLGKAATVKQPAEVAAAINPEDISHRDVVELARAHILAGVQGEGEVMKAVTQDLQQLKPEITERDVRRLFSEYGQVKFPSKDADKVALRELRALVQLQESIDRLNEGQAALKTGPQRDKATQAIREKRKQLDALLRKQERSNAADPEKLATYQQARAENLRHQIEGLEKQLATGERPPKGERPMPSEEVRALTERRDALRKQLDVIDNPPLSPDERYQRGRAKSIARQLQDVQRRLDAGDYARRSRPEPKALNAANTDAQFKLAKLKEEFARRQFESEMAKRHPMRKILGAIGETFNLARAILTSVDLSAVLRQGGFIVLGHPVRGARAVPAMLRAFATQKGEFAANEEIARRPNAPLYQRYGLELTRDSGHSLSKMEEAFMSRWIERIPTAIGGGLVRGSARSFTVFMNKLRADSFDAMAAALAKGRTLTPEEGKAIANYVNVATGRGHIGSKGQAAVALNTVFFAPRLVASRFNLLAGQPLYGGTKHTRGLVVQEYARFLMGVAVIFSLAAAAADKDDEPIVSLDPRSTDFLKIRFGHTYIDPMTGLSQVTVFLAREFSGEKVTTGSDLVPRKVVPLRPDYTLTGEGMGKDGKPPFGAESGFDVLTRFARTKLAPVPGAIVNTLTGGDVVGNQVSPLDTLRNNLLPMSMQNIAEVMTDNGTPKGATIFTLNLLGMGVQYRGERRTSQEEVEVFKKLSLQDKLKAYDNNPTATDKDGRDLRQIILEGNWQGQIAGLHADDRPAALAKLEKIRASVPTPTESGVWYIDRDGVAQEKAPPSDVPIERQYAAWQAKRKVSRAADSVRTAFGSGDEEAARARLEQLRGVLGPEVDIEVGYDEHDQPTITLRGAGRAREEAVQSALRSPQ